MFNIELPKIRAFINRERLYIWLLIFIILISAALSMSGPKNENRGLPGKISHKGNVASDLQKKMSTKEDLLKLIQKNKPLGYLLIFLNFAVMVVVFGGLFLDITILIIKREGGALIFPSVLQGRPGWDIWAVCKAAILFLWFGYVIMCIEWGLSKAIPGILSDENLISVVNVTISDFMIFIFIIYFALFEYKDKLISLGLSAKNFIKNIFYGIAGYIAAVPVLILILLGLILVSSALKYEPPVQPVMEIFLEEKNSRLVMYLAFFVAVFGPIAEETFFRGFLYTALKKRFGFKAALFSTSILFALLHANLAGFLPIMVLGMLLAYLFEKTGTLVASCTVHILHNTAMLGLLFIMKGLLK